MSDPKAVTEREGADPLFGVAMQLVLELRALWLHPAFKPHPDATIPERVWTEASPDASHLPRTGRPIRGGPGVKVRFTDYSSPSWGIKPRLHDVVFDTVLSMSHLPAEAKSEELEGVERAAQEAYTRLVDMCLRTGKLAARLYEARGFKHDEAEGVEKRLARDTAEGRGHLVFGMAQIIEDALGEAGLVWDEVATFDHWDRAAELLANSLAELAQREVHVYDVLAYLNAPLIDDETPVPLGSIPDKANALITLSYATDEDLRRARHEGFSLMVEDLPDSIRQANTVVAFPIGITVNAPVDTFLLAYPDAAHYVARVVDVLRIVHSDDIGVAALRVSPRSRYTPMIRRTYAWDFEPEVAPYQTRRMAYGVPPGEPLTSEELERIRGLLPVHLRGLDQKGFDVAIRRFRDSYERYHPDDRNRLLDIGIAFEALLLNDGEHKELTFRLSLRGARWLESAPERRPKVFAALRDLYALRSRIAHGETLETMKHRDQERLMSVMAEVPLLLRRALRMSLEGRGPVGIAKARLKDWWRAIELA